MKRNQAKVCSFFVKNECNRGPSCPFRHENITDEDLESLRKGGNVEQRIKERFNGINDPLAKKILSNVRETSLPDPPED
jgi:RNA recognition motif-containing protein